MRLTRYEMESIVLYNAEEQRERAKQMMVVHIDAEGNITTVIECTPEDSTDEYLTKTVSMTSGENRLKIVGFDCENIDLKMIFSNE